MSKKSIKPFGIEFLEQLSEGAMAAVNGGRHRHKHHHAGGGSTGGTGGTGGGPVYHTMMASYPGPNGTTIGDQ